MEPGLTYSPELVQWFHDMEIPNLVTDTIANEVTRPRVGRRAAAPQCADAQLRHLTEIAARRPADDRAADGQYTFLYAARPKLSPATGAPVNPIVIK